MPTAEGTKCAHPGCNCEVSGDQKYCSPACEKSASPGTQQTAGSKSQGKSDCGCNHSQCKVAA
jgi:hypothetical protein